LKCRESIYGKDATDVWLTVSILFDSAEPALNPISASILVASFIVWRPVVANNCF
jgi:hypothetical protein